MSYLPEPDLAGWWIVNHPKPEDRHAIADPCPLNELVCKRDRDTVRDRYERVSDGDGGAA